jgi:hypothetical protein
MGVVLITVMLAIASVVGLFATFIPPVRAFTMPRFGWIGLIVCLNPLIFLVPWFRNPSRQALMGSAFMTLTLGVVNAVQLLVTGTGSVVTNEFHDRLHSAWLWSVCSFVVAGAYLYWIAKKMPQGRQVAG